jgi:RNA polymerase sigma factor (sigma-70 family)
MNRRNRATDGPGTPTGAALFRQAQAGCRDSLAQLMAAHEGLVHAVVRRQALGCLPFAEAVQAGRIGLWRAILGFDPQRGTAFSTYAWTSIMHHVWREVKLAERTHGQAANYLSFGQVPAAALGVVDPIQAWEATAIQSTLQELAARLPWRLRIVVLACYGLNGTSPAIYPQISATLGLSAERARQLHSEALIWLRQPAHSQRLRLLLGRHTLADYGDGYIAPWRPRPSAGCAGEEGVMANPSAVQARAQDPSFVQQSSLGALRRCTASQRLPLRWPTPPDVPPSPKRTYRSHYVYQGWEDLLSPETWEHRDVLIAPTLTWCCVWSTFPGCAPCWLNAWAGPQPEVGAPSTPFPSFSCSAGKSPTSGAGPRRCATWKTRAMRTMPAVSASLLASSPPKVACAISSPPSAAIPRSRGIP